MKVLFRHTYQVVNKDKHVIITIQFQMCLFTTSLDIRSITIYKVAARLLDSQTNIKRPVN